MSHLILYRISNIIKRFILFSSSHGKIKGSRRTYTKADWLIWAAALSTNRADFESIVEPLWRSYNESPSRVPLTDWYDTVTSAQCGFQNRTVVGGYFIQLLAYKGYMKVN